jgi:hypothetical protein
MLGPDGLLIGREGDWTPEWFASEYPAALTERVEVKSLSRGTRFEVLNMQLAALAVAPAKHRDALAAYVDQVETDLALFRRQFVVAARVRALRERDVVGHVRRLAPQFRARLQALSNHPLVGEARGVGLIGAVELVADKPAGTPFDPALKVGAQAAKRAEAHGLIVRALIDNVVAVCPPLIITPDQLDALFDALTAALDDTAAWVRAGAG